MKIPELIGSKLFKITKYKDDLQLIKDLKIKHQTI